MVDFTAPAAASTGPAAGAPAPDMAAVAAADHSHLMVESGGKLAASLLHAEIVDRIAWTQSPHIIGADCIASVAAQKLAGLPATPAFKVMDQGQFGADRFILMERAAE